MLSRQTPQIVDICAPPRAALCRAQVAPPTAPRPIRRLSAAAALAAAAAPPPRRPPPPPPPPPPRHPPHPPPSPPPAHAHACIFLRCGLEHEGSALPVTPTHPALL
eukprot:scaffold30926_cov62-Phaeocystis_antarctica.AAC.9